MQLFYMYDVVLVFTSVHRFPKLRCYKYSFEWCYSTLCTSVDAFFSFLYIIEKVILSSKNKIIKIFCIAGCFSNATFAIVHWRLEHQNCLYRNAAQGLIRTQLCVDIGSLVRVVCKSTLWGTKMRRCVRGYPEQWSLCARPTQPENQIPPPKKYKLIFVHIT